MGVSVAISSWLKGIQAIYLLHQRRCFCCCIYMYMPQLALPILSPYEQGRLLARWPCPASFERKIINMPFSGYLLPLCQNSSLYETIHIKMGFTYKFILDQIKLIFTWKVLHRDWIVLAGANSEIVQVYMLLNIINNVCLVLWWTG